MAILIFFLTMVDDFTRHTSAFLIKRYETKHLIMQFTSLAHVQFGKIVKQIRYNNDKEFLMDNYFKDKCIIHRKTCIETL